MKATVFEKLVVKQEAKQPGLYKITKKAAALPGEKRPLHLLRER